MKKVYSALLPLIFLLIFPVKISALTHALIIQDDGIIFITQNSSQQVLGTTTTLPQEKNAVQINPPINDDKKIQVVVTHITTSVDKVVAQQSNGQPVISITSNHAHQLTIQQGSTQAITTLPLQINTTTHALSIAHAHQPTTINVLPKEAVQGMVHKGVLDTKAATHAGLQLTQDSAGLEYTMDNTKQGKLFGILPVTSSTHVSVSAENGKVVANSQSFLLPFLKTFIK